MRAALDPVVGDSVPFGTYYPAVLLVSLACGWRAGLITSLASGAIGNYLFIPPFLAFKGEPQEIAGTTLFIVAALMILVTAETLRRTVIELQQTLSRESELRLELAHRVNNNLAVIQGLVRQLAHAHPDPRAFYGALSDRLAALGSAHNVLSTGEWRNCNLPALVNEALGPFHAEHAEDGISVHGPTCLVPPATCVPLAMALHELATNAVKYGALSRPQGRVDVDWRLTPDDGRDRLHIIWQEHGGPRVQPPSRRGLGSRLLRPQTGLEDVRLTFAPDGVRCELQVEGARMVTPDPQRNRRIAAADDWHATGDAL